MEDCEAGILILHRNQEKKMNTDYSIKLLSDKARSLHGTAIQSVLRHADINKLKERIHIFQNMDIHFPMLYRMFFIISFLRSLSNTPAIGYSLCILLFSSFRIITIMVSI